MKYKWSDINKIESLLFRRICYGDLFWGWENLPRKYLLDESQWTSDIIKGPILTNETGIVFTNYIITKCLNNLIRKGWIERHGHGGINPDNGYPWYIRGYVMTENGKKTNTYNEVKKLHEKVWEDLINSLNLTE